MLGVIFCRVDHFIASLSLPEQQGKDLSQNVASED